MLFITEVNRDKNEGTNVLVFPDSYFEQKNYSDCYGQYGQQIGDSDAGNYICLTADQAAHMTRFWDNEENGEQTFSEGTIISAYDNYELFETVKEEFGDDCVEYETVLAYTYHDGSNFCTIVLDGTYPTHEAISEEDAKLFLEVIESEGFCMEKDGPYRQAYKTDEFIFVESNMQGHPEFCYIIDNNEQ